MRIDRKKIGVIHVAKAQLAMEEDDYRALLMRRAGVRSASQLDNDGFNRVMEEFQRLGFRSDFSRQHHGYRSGRANPGQIAVIRDLWSEFTGGKGGEKGLRKWLSSKFKVDDVRFIPEGTAGRVIGGLQAMNARRRPPPTV